MHFPTSAVHMYSVYGLYRQGWTGTLSLPPTPTLQPRPSWITRFVWPVICCCPPKPGKAHSDRKLNGTFRHSGDVSALYCTVLSTPIHVVIPVEAVLYFYEYIPSFTLADRCRGPFKPTVDEQFSRLIRLFRKSFLPRPTAGRVVRYCHYHTCILWGSDLHDNDKSLSTEYEVYSYSVYSMKKLVDGYYARSG